ncbi:uncharacterized protein BDZ99DRAFT_514742 [Mytilinidion resinicola]|uniref:Uncharacterized protein n=1 Tax=Mytilinidion resinicola TaxID=574789 RepID=A0A6A6Z757_9PEZI|nr:uncharacterized protein BDZ99DRAFT_514742 [Mytilinidion resinicola]KAF2816134.1 hypothetical protein BDZ99DRAFT_514742 [Mytilinidion resinicola]
MASRTRPDNPDKSFTILLGMPKPEKPKHSDWVLLKPCELPLEARCDHLQNRSTCRRVWECYGWQRGLTLNNFNDYIYTCENEKCSGHASDEGPRCYGKPGVVCKQPSAKGEELKRMKVRGTHEVKGWKDIVGENGLNKTMKKIKAKQGKQFVG